MAHYINFSKILITDSGTMASEAAVLGVPNILINNQQVVVEYIEN